jgi:hypothetical protein
MTKVQELHLVSQKHLASLIHFYLKGLSEAFLLFS